MALFGREIDPDYVPGVKLGMHSFQIIFSFLLWCLEIAVFLDKSSAVNSKNSWTFAVCFLSVPAWIFLVMTPRWQRTRRYAEPHAMLTVDAVFTILWISAFAAQAKYNSDGQCGDVCGLSEAVVALGVFDSLFWICSSLVSAFTLQYYLFHGVLPGYPKTSLGRTGAAAGDHDPDKSAFSVAPDGEHEPYDRVDTDDPEMMSNRRYDVYDPTSHSEDRPLASSGRFDAPSNCDQPYHHDPRLQTFHPAPQPGFDTRDGSPVFAQKRRSLPPVVPPLPYDDELVVFPAAPYHKSMMP